MAGAPTPQSGWQAALARGWVAKLDWVRAGEVVPLSALAERWRWALEAIEEQVARGNLFTVDVEGGRFVPVEFLELDADTLCVICRALQGLDASEKLIFWKRRHGALGGTTALSTLQGDPTGGLERVRRLAQRHGHDGRPG